MSECVVRMEMPQNCINCDLRYECNAFYAPGKPKPFMKGCRIICSLPKRRGRLVDADAFEKDVSEALVYGLKEIPNEEGKQIFHVLMQEVLDNVKKRETIVPAERSGT